MSERRGLWSLLGRPALYEAFHRLIGARRWLRRFATDVICAREGDRVLDIGCGSGALLRYLPATTVYVGLDRDEACIERARRVHRRPGEFICDDVGNLARHALTPVDVAVAIGILHHLDDDLASRLLQAAATVLKPRGRLITVDPCLHPEQNLLQRFVVSHDRGRHVRPFAHYLDLCGAVFPDTRATFQRGVLPFPHSICILQATRGSA